MTHPTPHPSPTPAPTLSAIAADVDTGIDDALALIYLSHWSRHTATALRVTTSAGNCTAAQAAANSAEVLRLCGDTTTTVTIGAPAPLHVALTTTPETHGPDGLGYHRTPALSPSLTDASSAADAVAAWAGADRLLVAGPATNLAHGHAPDVTLMCGAFDYPGNTTPTAEWNAWVDPHAVASSLDQLVASGVPHRLCPLNVTEQVLLHPDRLQRWCDSLREQGRGELASLMRDALRFYFEFHEQVGVGYCAQIHDLAAAMVMLGTVDYRTRAGRVQVEVDGERRGTTTVEWDDSAPTQVVVEIDVDGVFAEFERVVLGRAH